jgi:hypothetical protein
VQCSSPTCSASDNVPWRTGRPSMGSFVPTRPCRRACSCGGRPHGRILPSGGLHSTLLTPATVVPPGPEEGGCERQVRKRPALRAYATCSPNRLRFRRHEALDEHGPCNQRVNVRMILAALVRAPAHGSRRRSPHGRLLAPTRKLFDRRTRTSALALRRSVQARSGP